MSEYIKEMVYTANTIKPERLFKGTYQGIDFYVLSLGTHPCAYIDVTNTSLNNKNYYDIEVSCHGGLTYSRNYLATVDKKGWFIGWDYAHYMDYLGCNLLLPDYLQSNGKRWTTKEIIEECKNVIDQIKKLLL